MTTLSVDQLYAAGLSCEEIEGFRKAIRHPHVTDNMRFRPDEPLTGVRLQRFHNGASIAIRWRTMVIREQRSEAELYARERRAAGSARTFVTRNIRTNALDILHHAIGR